MLVLKIKIQRGSSVIKKEYPPSKPLRLIYEDIEANIDRVIAASIKKDSTI